MSVRPRALRNILGAICVALLVSSWPAPAPAAPRMLQLRRAADKPPASAPLTAEPPRQRRSGRSRSWLPRRPGAKAPLAGGEDAAPLAPRVVGASSAVPVGASAAPPEPLSQHSADLAVPVRTSDGCDPGVDVVGRMGIVRRSLRFHQDVYGRLRTLDTNLYVYRLHAAVYPAFRSLAFDGRVGLIAGYEGAASSDVRDRDYGARFATSHSELFGGLRVRRPVMGHVLGFDLTLGRLVSGLDDGSGKAGTPDVRYGEIRTSLDLSLRLGPVRTTWAAGFRLPLSYGEIGEAEWFPRLGGYGIDATASVAYPLSDVIALEIAASLRRFVLEMNSEPEDGSAGIAEVAGGAVDTFVGLYAGFSVAL